MLMMSEIQYNFITVKFFPETENVRLETESCKDGISIGFDEWDDLKTIIDNRISKIYQQQIIDAEND